MKKHVILTTAFLLISTFLYAELTKAQLWAISLTGILTEARGGYRNSLNDMAMNEIGRNSVLTTLSRDWGITAREELLETLDSLENGGHPDAFREIRGIVYEVLKAGNNQAAVQAVINSHQWDQTKWNRFRYVFNNWDKFEHCTLWGWNLARSISLCRWAYNAGFMTEAEAWKRIFHTAEILQTLFNSWEELGWDYYMGRLFWAASFGEEERYLRETEPIYNRLLNGYWSLLDWDIDLEAQEEDVPIISRDFLPPLDNDGTVQYLTNDRRRYYVGRQPTESNLLPSNPDPNVYELRVKKISGSNNMGYGMIFCADNSISDGGGYYRLYMVINGRFFVDKRTSSGNETLLSWRNAPHFQTGYGVYNTLRVEREDIEDGAVFWIFINGNLADAFIDPNPYNGRRFAPFVYVDSLQSELFPHVPVDVRFIY